MCQRVYITTTAEEAIHTLPATIEDARSPMVEALRLCGCTFASGTLHLPIRPLFLPPFLFLFLAPVLVLVPVLVLALVHD